MQFKIALPAEHINVIGAALGELPFKISAPVIDNIQKQVTAAQESTGHEDTEAPERAKLFGELAACIRTGQVPQDAVPRMLAADPAFADFYAALTERLKEGSPSQNQDPELPQPA